MAETTTYSFRAECWKDVEQFIAVAEVTVTMKRYVDPQLPDVEIQFESPAELGVLMAITDLIPDAHVIREMLRACPLPENSLEREYGR